LTAIFYSSGLPRRLREFLNFALSSSAGQPGFRIQKTASSPKAKVSFNIVLQDSFEFNGHFELAIARRG
jgi:hypothetical protein